MACRFDQGAPSGFPPLGAGFLLVAAVSLDRSFCVHPVQHTPQQRALPTTAFADGTSASGCVLAQSGTGIAMLMSRMSAGVSTALPAIPAVARPRAHGRARWHHHDRVGTRDGVDADGQDGNEVYGPGRLARHRDQRHSAAHGADLFGRAPRANQLRCPAEVHHCCQQSGASCHVEQQHQAADVRADAHPTLKCRAAISFCRATRHTARTNVEKATWHFAVCCQLQRRPVSQSRAARSARSDAADAAAAPVRSATLGATSASTATTIILAASRLFHAGRRSP